MNSVHPHLFDPNLYLTENRKVSVRRVHRRRNSYQVRLPSLPLVNLATMQLAPLYRRSTCPYSKRMGKTVVRGR